MKKVIVDKEEIREDWLILHQPLDVKPSALIYYANESRFHDWVDIRGAIEEELYGIGYPPAKILYFSQKNGYINSELFDYLADHEHFPSFGKKKKILILFLKFSGNLLHALLMISLKHLKMKALFPKSQHF